MPQHELLPSATEYEQHAVLTRRGPLARLRQWKRGLAVAVGAALTCAAVGDPVHVEVVKVGIENGHAELTLNRRISKDWQDTFQQIVDAKDFHRLVTDGWIHKRERWISIGAFVLVGDTLTVRDVPVEVASLRQLMRAVRNAVEKTNAAKPSEDRPRADSSLNGVLEEVFEKHSRERARAPPRGSMAVDGDQ